MKHLRQFENFKGKTKVLYFVSNTDKMYYPLYGILKERFDGLDEITADEVDEFINNIDDESFENDKWFVKDKGYSLEIYNLENEYVFAINKPI